jgi:hypothetical protein
VTSSKFDSLVQRLRFLRISGEPIEEQERAAKWWAYRHGLDWQHLLTEAQKPGPVQEAK